MKTEKEIKDEFEWQLKKYKQESKQQTSYKNTQDMAMIRALAWVLGLKHSDYID